MKKTLKDNKNININNNFLPLIKSLPFFKIRIHVYFLWRDCGGSIRKKC